MIVDYQHLPQELSSDQRYIVHLIEVSLLQFTISIRTVHVSEEPLLNRPNAN